MKRPPRADLPFALTLPLHFDLALRKRRWRRFTIGAIGFIGAVVVLAVALLAAGFRSPAEAELGRESFTAVDHVAARIETLAIGDELVLEGCGGRGLTYEVAALDVVDPSRVELEPGVAEDVVLIVAGKPFDAGAIGARLRYVVTARPRF